MPWIDRSALITFSARASQPLALLCGCLVLGHVALASDLTEVRVRRYASFVETPLVDSSSTAIGSQRSRIQAPDRAMTLALQDNSALAASVPDLQLQRGVVEDIPGSWVRLTRSHQGVNGLIWDGQELYVVAPSQTLTQTASGTGNVIYKLSEARAALPAAYCASDVAATHQATTAMQQYQALQQELSSAAPPADNTGTATLRLELQLLADSAFQAQFTTEDDARAALLTRINNVDGILSSQLQLSVEATDVQLLSAEQSASLPGTDAGSLLDSLASLRSNSATMDTYPVTYLITGRDLNGDTLGMSYIGQMCGAKYAVSLSESTTRGVWIDSLVMAHELGHQLGAVHDGTGMCASTDAHGYLMSANINGTSDISACSRQVMQNSIAHAACLVPSSLPTTLPQSSSNTPAPSDASQGGGGALAQWVLACLGLLAWARARCPIRG